MDDITYLKSCIKSIPDFPKTGILFRDITSICEDKKAFPLICRLMANKYKDKGITKVAATEARGFVFGAAIAEILNAGFILIRKQGKLPRAVYSESYALEYGKNILEIHQDSASADDTVLLVDDLIATGGTIDASIKLIKKTKAKIYGAEFAISLPDLGGEKIIQERYNIKTDAVLYFPGH